jgi:hypothetical protein
MEFIGLAVAIVFALTHLFGGKLRFLDVIPRSRWLSAAGGVSVAYVFLHLLPEVAHAEEVLAEHDQLGVVATPAFLVALVGLVVFYGLERAARQRRPKEAFSGTEEPGEEYDDWVFWLHIASYSVYNLIIGYLLVHGERRSLDELVLYAVAIGLHFFVTDYGLRHEHKRAYKRYGRWILAGVILAGWALGMAVQVSEITLLAITAFLAGGIVMNVLKEELPAERESRFSAFFLGTAAYAGLLLVI